MQFRKNTAMLEEKKAFRLRLLETLKRVEIAKINIDRTREEIRKMVKTW